MSILLDSNYRRFCTFFRALKASLDDRDRTIKERDEESVTLKRELLVRDKDGIVKLHKIMRKREKILLGENLILSN